MSGYEHPIGRQCYRPKIGDRWQELLPKRLCRTYVTLDSNEYGSRTIDRIGYPDGGVWLEMSGRGRAAVAALAAGLALFTLNHNGVIDLPEMLPDKQPTAVTAADPEDEERTDERQEQGDSPIAKAKPGHEADGSDKDAKKYPCSTFTASDKNIRKLDNKLKKVARAKYRNNGLSPFVQIAIGCGETEIVSFAVGTTAGGKKITTGTPTDMASVTKMDTAFLAMVADKNGELEMDKPMSRDLTGLPSGAASTVTYNQEFQHRGGDPDDYDAVLAGHPGPGTVKQRIVGAKVGRVRGLPHYSNQGINKAFLAASAAVDMPLGTYGEKHLFGPAGMRDTGYAPDIKNCTAKPCASDDRMARGFGYQAGNASLFSTAHDQNILSRIILGCGELNGVRYAECQDVRLMYKNVTGDARGDGQRGVGTKVNNGKDPFFGSKLSRTAVGHFGDIGTANIIDSKTGLTINITMRQPYDGRISQKPKRDGIRAIADTTVDMVIG